MWDDETLFHEAGPKLYQLPNGMEIAYQSSAEIEFFYKDIFEKEIYLRHGVQLRDGNCVFDVGANVGFFTLFAHQQATSLKIYAFEPAPPLFEILSFNVARHGVNAQLFNCGLSDHKEIVKLYLLPKQLRHVVFLRGRARREGSSTRDHAEPIAAGRSRDGADHAIR